MILVFTTDILLLSLHVEKLPAGQNKKMSITIVSNKHLYQHNQLFQLSPKNWNQNHLLLKCHHQNRSLVIQFFIMKSSVQKIHGKYSLHYLQQADR